MNSEVKRAVADPSEMRSACALPFTGRLFTALLFTSTLFTSMLFTSKLFGTPIVNAQSARANDPPKAHSDQGTLLTNVTFTEYTKLSTNVEIARRVLSPLGFRSVEQRWQQAKTLREQAIDLTRERFVMYVPANPAPPAGYGLLVFIAPWSHATEPNHWRPPLDRHGLIFVAAGNSGNDTAVLDRRLPLALLAYENVRQRYPIDPARIYVSGLSGGSRVAQVAALAYPDIFRGALLNAGSDPIGDQRRNLPPADLFQKFQQRRVVYVTGEHDTLNLAADRASRNSLKTWCVFDVAVQEAPRLGHELVNAAALNRALDVLDPLETKTSRDVDEFARCNARIQQSLAAELTEASAALARGDRADAQARIVQIDKRFGGVAAPAVLELQARLDQLSAP